MKNQRLKRAKAKLRERGFGYMRCRICGKILRYKRGYSVVNGVEPNRLIVLRRHYKRSHPKIWKRIIERALKKRGRS